MHPKTGSDGRTRTNHTQIFSLLLYLMSYVAIIGTPGRNRTSVPTFVAWCPIRWTTGVYVWRRRRESNSPWSDRQSVALPENYYGINLEHRARFELAVLQFCRLLRWASPPPVHCLERVGRVELRNISLEDCRAPLAAIYPRKIGTAAGVEPSAGI